MPNNSTAKGTVTEDKNLSTGYKSSNTITKILDADSASKYNNNCRSGFAPSPLRERAGVRVISV
jgi:hypothetical protein